MDDGKAKSNECYKLWSGGSDQSRFRLDRAEKNVAHYMCSDV